MLDPIDHNSGVTTIHESGVFVTVGVFASSKPLYCSPPHPQYCCPLPPFHACYCFVGKPSVAVTVVLAPNSVPIPLSSLSLSVSLKCCTTTVVVPKWLLGASLTVTPATVCPAWPHRNPSMWEPRAQRPTVPEFCGTPKWQTSMDGKLGALKNSKKTYHRSQK